MKRPSQIFLFVFVVAMEHNFLLLFAIWKHALPRIEPDILFLENSNDLLHFVSVFKIQEKAPFGVDKVRCKMFWNKD